jgi:hypothetical protein
VTARPAAAGVTVREKLPKMPLQSEASFQRQVIAYAQMRGWLTYHVYDSRRCVAGFPDLVLVRRPHVIFAELKRQNGKVSEDQQTWLDELKACGQMAVVWRPSDWQEIEEALI